MISNTSLLSFTTNYGFIVLLIAALAPLVYVGIYGSAGYRFVYSTIARLLKVIPQASMLDHPSPLVGLAAAILHTGVILAVIAHLVLFAAQWNGGLYQLTPSIVQTVLYAKKTAAIMIVSSASILAATRLYTGVRFGLFSWKHACLLAGDLLLIALAASGLLIKAGINYVIAHVILGYVAIAYFLIAFFTEHRLYSRVLAEKRILEV
ncbi:hypothetical protein Pyrde_0387 [Pyrodictium delaneyi]|nr:hypothetical protein [Pyrodictium delaneyi]ALL00437.1 hypothetical protein Pyrde_0387 [Pyrodictium delaneyi]